MEAEQMQENLKSAKVGNKDKTDKEDSSSSSSESVRRKEKRKKKKKTKKEKKEKKKHKKHKGHKVNLVFSLFAFFVLLETCFQRKHSARSDSGDEWVEVTNEMRQAEAERVKQQEAELIGPSIPDHLLQKNSLLHDHAKHVK